MYLLLVFNYIVSVKSLEILQNHSEIYYCDRCDVILGGLVAVHEKQEDQSRFGECGDGFKNFAIPRVEAMLFAIDKINNDKNLSNGINFGIHIHDTCGIATLATVKSKDFVRETFNHGCTFNNDTTEPYFAGVIGGMYSSVSIAVATFLQPWGIPQISPASTSVKLSDKDRFKLFSRTVPSDRHQYRAIVDILDHLNWTLISTIISYGSYSPEVIEEFNKIADERGICNSNDKRIPHNPTDANFEAILCSILLETNSNVVVLFTNVEDTRRIFATASRLMQQHKGTVN